MVMKHTPNSSMPTKNISRQTNYEIEMKEVNPTVTK